MGNRCSARRDAPRKAALTTALAHTNFAAFQKKKPGERGPSCIIVTMDTLRSSLGFRVLAAPLLLVSLAASANVRADEPSPAAPPHAPNSAKTLRLPVCNANEALAVRAEGTYVCKLLSAVPATLAPDCSLGSAHDDGTATCVPRGTGQTDAYYTTRKDALARWLDAGTGARLPTSAAPTGKAFECGAFTKISAEAYRCETTPSKTEAPALPTLKCGAGQTVTFTAQHEVKCADLPAGRVALPCADFASGQTSHDGITIDCVARNQGAIDEPLLARTLDYLYRIVENQAPRELARPVKSSLRTGRIPMCGEGQTLVFRDAALTCASRGAAGITKTDATVLKQLVERVIVKLQRMDPALKDPFLPGAKLGDNAAIVFLDAHR